MAGRLLDLNNPRKVITCLTGIVDQGALDLIEKELERNVVSLFQLGMHHYRFAIKQSSPNWRQKVSRLYYSAYHVARSVRLYSNGDYAVDVSDHKNIGKLPNDFPRKARYSNKLSILRTDRNLADYGHSAKASELAISTTDAGAFVAEFIEDAKKYFLEKGLKV